MSRLGFLLSRLCLRLIIGGGVAKPSLPNPIGLWNLDTVIPYWDSGSFVHISARRFIQPIYGLSCAC
jgi:hypothetical protein